MKRLFLMLCCTLVLLAGCSKDASKSAAVTAREKSPAPEVKLISMDNEQLTLGALKGKVVMLNFWATWCPPCREEIPSMMKLNSFMEGKPFQMVCISVDEGGKKAVQDFFNNSGYSLPTYFDPSGDSIKNYGLTGVPETFIIDKEGVIAKRVIGGLDWHSPDVIAFLEKLMH